jgi:hypothetical protein
VLEALGQPVQRVQQHPAPRGQPGEAGDPGGGPQAARPGRVPRRRAPHRRDRRVGTAHHPPLDEAARQPRGGP